jgi:hypothetical protein
MKDLEQKLAESQVSTGKSKVELNEMKDLGPNTVQ